MSRDLSADPGVRVGADGRNRISELARALEGEERREQSSDVLAELGAMLVTALPVELVRAVHRYANHGGHHDTLLITGLLPEDAGLQPTPETPVPADLDVPARHAACLRCRSAPLAST